MNYTNEMKYKHSLRRIQKETISPTCIRDEMCELDNIISEIVWAVRGSGMSFDAMVEESMEIERIQS